MDVILDDIYLSIETIETALVNQYGICPKRLSLLNRGGSLIYRFEDELGALYVLKLLNHKYPTEVLEIAYDIASYLKDNDFPVPIYYKTVNGVKYSDIGGYNAFLMSFLRGKRIGDNKGDQKMIFDLSDFYGRLINSLESIPFEIPYPKASKFHLAEVNFLYNKFESLIDAIRDKNIVYYLQRKMKMLEGVCYHFDYEYITYVNSIGDFTHFQLLYDKDNNICGLLDFDSSKRMPAVYELFRSYIFCTMCYNEESGFFPIRELVSYIKHYLSYNSLSGYDLKYFFYPFYIEMLKSTFGFEQYAINNRNRNALLIGINIFNKCNYLHNRIDELSYQLSKEI